MLTLFHFVKIFVAKLFLRYVEPEDLAVGWWAGIRGDVGAQQQQQPDRQLDRPLLTPTAAQAGSKVYLHNCGLLFIALVLPVTTKRGVLFLLKCHKNYKNELKTTCFR
jgi:hypothetical protein